MIRCQVCRATNSDDDIFCSQCGTRIKRETDVLLDEMRNFKPIPAAVNAEQRVNVLRQMMEENPPSYQSYPTLAFFSLLIMIFGAFLIFCGLVGFGIVMMLVSEVNGIAAFVADMTLLVLMIVSIAAIVSGLQMVSVAEQTKLFIDLQENADRQSIALHGIFHLLMLSNERRDQKDQ